MPDIHSQTLSHLEAFMKSGQADVNKLNNMLRYLAKYRSHLIQNTIIANGGTTVRDGPFQGMEFLNYATEGCYVPKVLGCYEYELHEHFLAAARRGYDVVIDIGAAEGYYAVGLARLMPSATIIACDTNPAARHACKELMEKNGVSQRIIIGGEFRGDDFAAYTDRKTLVVCDIEGAETALLDPERYPALRRFDLIVELHDGPHAKASTLIPARFQATHHVEIVRHSGRNVKLPPVLEGLGHLDQLLAVWEWRMSPTPWAVMIAR